MTLHYHDSTLSFMGLLTPFFPFPEIEERVFSEEKRYERLSELKDGQGLLGGDRHWGISGSRYNYQNVVVSNWNNPKVAEVLTDRE